MRLKPAPYPYPEVILGYVRISDVKSTEGSSLSHHVFHNVWVSAISNHSLKEPVLPEAPSPAAYKFKKLSGI